VTTRRYLLDTDILIYLIKQSPASVVRRFEVLKPGEAIVSIITYGELLYGCEKSSQRDRSLGAIQDTIVDIPVEPLPFFSAAAYGVARATLERRGAIIGNNDLWIAAHAIAADLTLVTNNEREFRRIPDLKVENWVTG
jgi:tRNA(fMet)-specific endonuclease VapC